MGLAQRMYLISSVLIGALVLVAVTVWVLTGTVVERAVHIESNTVPQLQRIGDIELNVTRASLLLRHAILARTPEEMNAALADVTEKARAIESLVGEFGKKTQTEADRKVSAPLNAMMNDFLAKAGEDIKLIQAGQKGPAFAYLAEDRKSVV